MTKTYRRKDANWEFQKWHASDWVWVEDNDTKFLSKVYFAQDSAEYKKELNKYRRDRKHYGSGVPAWYVRLHHEKPYRQHAKQEIHKFMKKEDYEPNIPRYIKDAGWYWW
jgi:hypothetical protein